MAFDKRFVGKMSTGAGVVTPTIYAYRYLADTVAAITADGYFNDWNELRVGDLIAISGTDATKWGWYQVTDAAASGTVKVAKEAAAN